MGPLDGYEMNALRDDVAWTLREWYDALYQVNASVEAELYACAAAVVLVHLDDCHTFQHLLSTFDAPDDKLTSLLAQLCTEGEILLRPYLLLGASCALRLRQLVCETSA